MRPIHPDLMEKKRALMHKYIHYYHVKRFSKVVLICLVCVIIHWCALPLVSGEEAQ